MVPPILTNNHVIALVDLHCVGPRHFGDFRNIIQPNTDEDQTKSYYLSAEPLELCHMVNPALVIVLRS